MRTVGLLRLVCIALACCFIACATWAAAADSAAPERLLAADSIVYWRFDGWTPHRAAMDRTAFGEMMRGDFGKFLDYTQQLVAKSFAADTFGQSLLAGKRPDELAKTQAAARQIPLLWPAICNHGVALGIEKSGSATIILPRGKPLYAVAQLFGSQLSDPVVETRIKDRMVLVSEPKQEPAPAAVTGANPPPPRYVPSSNAPGPVPAPDAKKENKKPDPAAKPAKSPDEPTRTLAWTEGDDLVIVVAAEPAEKIVSRVLERRARNLLDSPIYKRLAGFKDYETLSQGFVDPQAFLALMAKANDFDDLPKFVAGIGLGSVRQLFWHTGVEGRNQRYTLELLAPGKRHGVLKMFSGGGEMFDGCWPGFLPPDANQVHAFNINLNGFYDEFRNTALATAQLMGGDDAAKAAHALDDAQREATKQLGIDIQRDLLDSLGSTMVVFSAPSEGPIFLGTGVAIQATRPEKLRKVLAEIGRTAVAEAGGSLKINHRDFHGTDLATILYGTGNADDASLATPFTPSYAIHNGWLVLALNPQTVEGCILRAPEKTADFASGLNLSMEFTRPAPGFQSWRPSPLFIEMLAKPREKQLPKARLVSIGESDPRPAVKFALSFAPLIGSYVANTKAGKFDNSMIPNTQSVVEPLYPNVWSISDDGEAFRIEGYKSAPFPLDSSFLIAFFVGTEFIAPFGIF